MKLEPKLVTEYEGVRGRAHLDLLKIVSRDMVAQSTLRRLPVGAQQALGYGGRSTRAKQGQNSKSQNRGRLWSEIYPHTKLFPDLTLNYTGVQHEL
jgi:hypothetical protein